MNNKQTLLEFPCAFTVKAMGLAVEGFEEEIFNLLKGEVPELLREHLSCKPSKAGKYVSVSIAITATSKAQLDRIYQLLTDCESVLMAL